MTTFQKAFAWTAIPLVVLSVASTGGVWTQGILYAFWFIAFLGWLIALFVAAGFGIAGKPQVAAGIMAGFAVGFVALSVTCFANLNVINST